MRVWKVIGMAGIAGVAATGVAVARAERRRRSFEPDDVRARLHQRFEEAAPAAPVPGAPPAADLPPGCATAAWGRLRAVVPRRRAR